MLKAFGCIERVVKYDFFSEKTCLLHMCATFSELPSYIITMGTSFPEGSTFFVTMRKDSMRNWARIIPIWLLIIKFMHLKSFFLHNIFRVPDPDCFWLDPNNFFWGLNQDPDPGFWYWIRVRWLQVFKRNNIECTDFLFLIAYCNI